MVKLIVCLIVMSFSDYLLNAMDCLQGLLTASASHSLDQSYIYDEAPEQFPLHEAARTGNLEKVKTLLETNQKFSTQSLNENHETPLYCAGAAGHLPVVQYLMEQKWASPLLGDDFSYSPLHKASENGHTSIVEYFLKKYTCLVNAVSKDKTTSLMLAARNGHGESAKVLCKHGAFVNAVNEFNSTALHMAVTGGDPQTVEVLLEAGASVFIRSNDTGRETPLEKANIKKLVYANHFQASNYAQIVTLLEKAEAKQSIDD